VAFNNRSATASPRNRSTVAFSADSKTAAKVPGQEVKVQLPQITIEERHSFSDDMASPMSRRNEPAPPPSEDGHADIVEAMDVGQGYPPSNDEVYQEPVEFNDEEPSRMNEKEIVIHGGEPASDLGNENHLQTADNIDVSVN